MPCFSWNLKIQDAMTGKLSVGFDNLEEEIDNTENVTFTNVKGLFEAVQEELKGRSDSPRA